MLDLLSKLLNARADFIELRAQESSVNSFVLKNKELDASGSGNTVFFSARAMVGGAWGFASTSSASTLKDAVDHAVELAKLASKRSPKLFISNAKPICKDFKTKPKKDTRDISFEEKVSTALEVSKDMVAPKGIVSSTLAYSDEIVNSFYANSEGARLSSILPYINIIFMSYAKSGARLEKAGNHIGGTQGFELLEQNMHVGTEISRRALALLKAEVPKSDTYTVVVDPYISGVFAHEALGHACEADFIIIDGSVLSGKLGTRIGSEHVTMIDDATIPNAYGSFHFDDEGVLAQKKVLVKNGILESLLHSRATAKKLNAPASTGNARAEDVTFAPIVRMSNTYFAPGGQSFDEITDIKDGIYLERIYGGGQVDTVSGNFQFAAEAGNIIKDGELTTPIKSATFAGNILGTLMNVEAATKQLGSEFHAGTCGKNSQGVPVGDNGPFMRIKGVKVGGK